MDLAEVTGPPHLAERFWWYVDKGETAEGCWRWTASDDGQGYGHYSIVYAGRRRSIKAHRLSWLLAYGSVPDDMHVCHECDVHYAAGDISYRLCVRPDHLSLGSDADNVRHMMATGRFWRRSVGTADVGPRPTRPARLLTDADVLEMRRRFAAGERLCALSRVYGIAASHVARIVYGQAWSHLAGASPKPPTRVIARGAQAGNARLSAADVLALRARFVEGESKASLARAFALSASHVRDIVHGVLWPDLPGVTPRPPLALAARRSSAQAGAKLSAEAVRAIRRRAAAGERQSGLAREYGVSTAAIHALLRGRTYVQVLLDNDE